MVDISNASQDLFFKLRNRFPKISMGDEDGNATVDPEAARFFAFTYTDKESNRAYGQVTCSVIDNSSLKVYFDTQITADMLPEDKPYWFRFLRELRRMAKSHMLNFDVRDITKDVLSRQDLQYMTKLNPEKKKITKESITEARVIWQRRGKVSEGDLNSVRIHVVHSEKMLENSNNRLLKVDRIYCVNENGEKFLLPFKSVSGAKAMANHISRGGNPYDTNGQVISRAVNEMRNLSKFTSATRTKTFESEEANQVITAAQQMKESIRGHLARLTNNSRNFGESLEALNKLLPESEHDITELKGWFTTQAYNENLDNYLASAAGAYQRLKENAFEIAEAPADVEHKIMSPEFKLVLKADPAMDKLMTSRKYADNKALLTAVLGDIANRSIGAQGDDIANFASMMGDLISSEGDAFGQRPDPEYNRDKKLAIMLAQKYMKDLAAMRTNPELAAQVRQDPEARTKMADRRDKSAGDEFEEAIMGIGEQQVDEISLKKKMHAYAASQHPDADYTYGEKVYDQGDRIRNAIVKKHGEKMGKHADAHAHADAYGRSEPGKTPSDYFKRDKLSDPQTKGPGDARITKSGIMNKQDQKYNANTIKARLGKHRTPDLPESEQDSIHNESEENLMSIKQIEEMRKLAGLPVMENYIYAAEEDEETTEETGDMIDEIEADHEGMAAEGEEHDGEYSDEAGMAKDQLTHAEKAAAELKELLASDEDLPEWVQAKITKAADYLDMAYDTMDSRHEQGDVHKMSEAAKPDYIDLDKDGDKEESMKKAAADKKKMDMEEEVTDEGNEFTGALAKAKAAHKDEFEVDGKKYKVKESSDETISWLQAVAGIRTK